MTQILKTAQRTPYKPFVSVPFDHPAVIALRPMLTRILTHYGLTENSRRLDIAQALRDHVARTQIHPHLPLHPNGYGANLAALPTDAPTWAQFNAAYYSAGNTRAADENTYWGQFGFDGIKRIEMLYGTLNRATGELANDGMFVEYEPGKWRWRSINTTKSTQCTYQSQALAHFQAAFGIPATFTSTVGHDGHIAYVVDDDAAGDLGWIYDEPTYNECFTLGGAPSRPLSPLTLHYFSVGGRMNELISTKRAGPAYDPAPYIPNTPGLDDSYFMGNPGHPLGMYVLGSHLNFSSIDVAPSAFKGVATMLTTPGLFDGSLTSTTFNRPNSYYQTTAEAVFPDLGVMFTRVEEDAQGVQVQLESSWCGPTPHRFERRVNGGAWAAILGTADTLARGQGVVEYRVIDALGFKGSRASVKV